MISALQRRVASLWLQYLLWFVMKHGNWFDDADRIGC